VRRARSPCSTPGCPEITDLGRSRCASCIITAEQTRGTAAQRGYGRGHTTFRRLVLRRDPICVRCREAPATAADHHPLSRRDLVERGLNPNDPVHGRGLCHRCHSIETAAHQPGGWHR
jgi:5-methylcytosine-specific restriction protein A